MNANTNAWGAHVTAELARHITEHLNPLLPDGVGSLAAGLHVVIEKTAPRGAPRAVSSFELQLPLDFESTPIRQVAGSMLRDIQDEIVTYLHKPWPVNDAFPSLA